MAEASHCTMMSHIPAAMPKPAAERPLPDQGDTEARPRPDPRASRISETAAAVTAPAMIAAQDTAETGDSIRAAAAPPRSVRPVDGMAARVLLTALMPQQGE